eukprot:7340496-Ditylum_brightwellii.AAC.1
MFCHLKWKRDDAQVVALTTFHTSLLPVMVHTTVIINPVCFPMLRSIIFISFKMNSRLDLEVIFPKALQEQALVGMSYTRAL